MGFFWGFIKPLLYLFIFIIIFGENSGIPNYPLFATSGLIFWFFFSNVTGQSIGSVVGSAGLLKSLNIPAFFFPLSETISELFNFLLSLIVFFVVMRWFGLVYDLKLLLVVPCIFLFAIFSLGLNLFLCSINVFFKDIGIIWGTIQPALFFLTPIAYREQQIVQKYKAIIEYNPIYQFIKLGRNVLYDPAAATAHDWIVCLSIAGIMYVVGHFVFYRLKNQFISAI